MSHPPSCMLVNHGPLTAELQRRIQAMEMRCYRKILHISYKDCATNEKVHAKIQQAIGPHEDLLTIVKRCKLKWYGHVSRSSGLAKTILQGTEPTDNQTTQRPPMTIKKHMLQRHGHVSCLSGLAKTVLQGTVKGGRRQGRQRKRWEDNIREWTSLEFGKSQRAVENVEKWRKLVAKSLWCPNDPRG